MLTTCRGGCAFELNYIEKHRSVNLTAEGLVKAGIGGVCATRLHG